MSTDKAPVPSGAGGGSASRARTDFESQLLQQLGVNPPMTPGAIGGAAAAAGVLTAVDEDQEGDEEAQPPQDFTYFTDAEDDDDE